MVSALNERLTRLREYLRGGELSPARLGQSVALGFFVGTLPLYGLQTLLSSAIGWLFGFDVIVVALASNISLPPFIPLLLFLDLTAGSLILHGHGLEMRMSEVSLEQLAALGVELVVGSLVVSVLVAALGFFVAYLIGRRVLRRRAAAIGEEVPTT